ncbi:DUF6350 family protein [Cellulomonas sp. PhB143]|uniref:cell division protein PerM n=1 Tax=Cellulomonas sp. PhB143 TaxID=2485186 RepID=UPI000F47EDCD|nr:DUF6350 family protein [Cellulomonas sp. PhB143]
MTTPPSTRTPSTRTPSTRTPSTRAPRRTLDDRPAPVPRGGLRLRQALSGVLAALQALVLTYALVVLPAVVAVLGSADATDDGWGSAVSVAGGLWVLGHGAPWQVSGATITLVPLGLTALFLVAGYASARRAAHASLAAWGAGAATYAGAVAGVGAAAGAVSGTGVLLAAVGGGLLGAVAVGGGLLARPGAPTLDDLPRARRLVPPAVRLGARTAVVGLALALALAAVTVAFWAVVGRSTSADVVEALSPGTLGGLVLGVGQLLVVPDLVLWGLAWLAGPGFSVGAGSTFAPGARELGPLPSVPLLGGLPGAPSGTHADLWAPALVVLCGIVAGWYAWRGVRRDAYREGSWRDALVLLATTVVVVLAVAWVLLTLASGAVGPGAMQVTGARAPVAAPVVAAEIGAGVLVVLGAGWLRALVAQRRDPGLPLDER